jgi:hypothetical protein
VAESILQRVGGAEFPVDVTDIDATASFAVLDPARAALAAYFAAVLRAELGNDASGAWYAVTSRLPTSHRLYAAADPVGTVWQVEPSAALLRQVKVATWPLLVVWPEGPGEFEQVTFARMGVRRKWCAMWCLGDYEADLALKLEPVLHRVGALLGMAVSASRHPAYDSGLQQFGEDRGWLSSIRPSGYEAGAARFSDDDEARFWAASATFDSLELVRDLEEGDGSGASSFGITAAIGDATELLPDFIQGDGDFPGT